MHRETKATAIPSSVKAEVWRRDMTRCVICGSVYAAPHCHYVRRSQGGKGVPENIWTGCDECHMAFDSEGTDGVLHDEVRAHLKAHYPNWDETKLVYHKYDF